MNTFYLLTFYCVAIVYSALVGGYIAAKVNLYHRQLQVALSFVSGLILGIALLHLLPEAVEKLHEPHDVAYWILLGLLAIFVLERFFCFHHHDVEDEHHGHSHGDGCGHTLSWPGITVGLTIHSVLAGVALASSVQAEAGVRFAGFGVFLAILLHKPFDSLTIATLMNQSFSSLKKQMLVIALFSLAVPLGVGLFEWGVSSNFLEDEYLGITLAVSCGVFLCIALSDLLPELHFHQHDRIILTLSLLAGIGLAYLSGGHGHH